MRKSGGMSDYAQLKRIEAIMSEMPNEVECLPAHNKRSLCNP